MLKLCLFSALAGILLMATPSQGAPEVLTSLAAVRTLPVDKAAAHLPVELEATVTSFDWNWHALFIHDGQDGIYVVYPATNLIPAKVHRGDQVRIKAVTDSGDYQPQLILKSMTYVGAGTLPKPVLITPQNIFLPAMDCQWVELNGTLVDVEREKQQFILTLELNGGKVAILTPWSDEAEQSIARLVQSRVIIHGVCLGTFNPQRQMTARFFYLPSMEFIQPAQLNESNKPVILTDMNQLQRSDTKVNDTVKVRGVVTRVLPREIFIRGNAGSLHVFMAATVGFRTGDRVEAEGFSVVAPFRPNFYAQHVTQLERGEPPVPLELPGTLEQLREFQAELVTTKARFLNATESPNEISLHCRINNRFFDAVLPKSSGLLTAGLISDSTVRISGICQLSTSRPLLGGKWINGFSIHLRGPQDLQVLSRPAWWSAQKLLVLLTIIVGIGVFAAIWIGLLRRQIAQQTRIIRGKIERESVLNERQRIARDLHDTLEQQMTGVGIQLAYVAEQIEETPEPVQKALQLARKMVNYCCKEANSTVHNLRSELLEEHGLVGAIRELLPPLAAAGNVRLVVEMEGTPPHLDAVVESHLLHLAQESVANAVQHAAAHEIRVQLDFTPDCTRLTIADDGRGFDSNAHPLTGHFGLIGMQERVKKMRGSLAIESSAGNGTVIRVTVQTVPGPETQKPSPTHDKN